MKFTIAALAGALLTLAILAHRSDARLSSLEEHTRFLTQWTLIQKMRADQIECGMGNPFGRVNCAEVFQ